MDSPGYIALTRQSGLMRELNSVALNIANISTTGYRREVPIFAEFVKDTGQPFDSLSMTNADVRNINQEQGPLTQTKGTFDFAIEGEGYFLLETPEGQMLSRAGSFTPNADGELVAPDGARLLDGAGAPVFVPADATSVSVAADGTLSVDGQPFAQLGVWAPNDPTDLGRRAGSRFMAENGVQAIEGGVILQGYLEGSNVDPISEISRMIEVQHAYEQAQKFIDKEDERIRAVIRTLGR
ncbi:flagellar hook-basal body complex protein [Pseudoruegeria sp. HB172150]|uniref:flagellar hook-basal body complex protein n=1 Tax=Pseudoruegeria sp. HB172150 TaxID=2721164 RepID=UPI0015564322|nr:flagellar hook-basal body complex protein [Pseudoruegeria sp. HB172150]